MARIWETPLPVTASKTNGDSSGDPAVGSMGLEAEKEAKMLRDV
mgnify:CR=1 FL=1